MRFGSMYPGQPTESRDSSASFEYSPDCRETVDPRILKIYVRVRV